VAGPVTPTRSRDRRGRVEAQRAALGEALTRRRRTRVRFPAPPPNRVSSHPVHLKGRGTREGRVHSVSGPRISPVSRPGRLRPDHGSFGRLDGLGAPGRRHDAVGAFEVEQDALEPCLVVGPAGLIIRVPVDARLRGGAGDEMMPYYRRPGSVEDEESYQWYQKRSPLSLPARRHPSCTAPGLPRVDHLSER
jgi:hypothetical protein